MLEAANNLISHNIKRKKKKLWTNKEKGVDVAFEVYGDQDTECLDICNQILKMNQILDTDFNKFAILTRTNGNSKDFEKYLL